MQADHRRGRAGAPGIEPCRSVEDHLHAELIRKVTPRLHVDPPPERRHDDDRADLFGVSREPVAYSVDLHFAGFGPDIREARNHARLHGRQRGRNECPGGHQTEFAGSVRKQRQGQPHRAVRRRYDAAILHAEMSDQLRLEPLHQRPEIGVDPVAVELLEQGNEVRRDRKQRLSHGYLHDRSPRSPPAQPGANHISTEPFPIEGPSPAAPCDSDGATILKIRLTVTCDGVTLSVDWW